MLTGHDNVSLTTQWTNATYGMADAGPVLRLLQTCMGLDSHGARLLVWKWKHLQNPFGESFIRLARGGGGQVVGLRALMQWQFRIGGRTLRAVRAVDTATHPEFRRMGIFQALTRLVIEDVREDGIGLVFNTPNRFSLPGYLKMGWHAVGVAQPLVHILRPSSFAVGMARCMVRIPSTKPYSGDPSGGTSASGFANLLESEKTAGDLHQLLSRSNDAPSSGQAATTNRSMDFLRWRYARHPYINYHAVTVRGATGIDGIAIFRCNTRFGLREVVLAELVLAESTEELGQQVLGELKKQVRADYIIGYFCRGSFQRQVLERSGYHKAPKGGIAITARPLDESIPLDAFTLDSWSFSLGDLELF